MYDEQKTGRIEYFEREVLDVGLLVSSVAVVGSVRGPVTGGPVREPDCEQSRGLWCDMNEHKS